MIKLSVGVGVGAMIGRAAAALARLIPQFNGTDNYAALDTPAAFTGDFEAEIVAACTTAAADARCALIGSASTSTFVSAIASGGVGTAYDTVQLRMAFAYSTNVPPQGGITPFDGGTHVWSLRVVGTLASLYIDDVFQVSVTVGSNNLQFDSIGINGTTLYPLRGGILSVKFTDKSGAEDVVTEHILNTKTPTGLTYTNFDPVVDWHDYLWNEALSRWDYQGSGIAGSQLMQFDGTALTPLSSSITVTGSTWEMNWEGLWVEHYISGVGAYTYLAAPDGVPMRCDIHDIDSVTAYSMINEKTTVQSVDNALAAFAESVTRSARVCDVTLTGNSIPTAAGLANKAIIEAEGGTVLVDS